MRSCDGNGNGDGNDHDDSNDSDDDDDANSDDDSVKNNNNDDGSGNGGGSGGDGDGGGVGNSDDGATDNNKLKDDDCQRRKGVDGKDCVARGRCAVGWEASAQQEVTQQPAIQEAQEGHNERRRVSMVLLPTNGRHNN